MFDGAPVSSFTYRRELFDAVIDEGRPILARQWEEAGEAVVGPFGMNEDRYRMMEKAGALRIYVVRNDEAIVGHLTMFVFMGMHAEAKAALMDAMYILPEFRRPFVSIRLVRFAERDLARSGVSVVHMNSNERFPGFARLLGFLGYHPISRTHAKVLNNAS